MKKNNIYELLEAEGEEFIHLLDDDRQFIFELV